MISDLNKKPYAEVIAMLERLAEKNDLLLSSNLIDFADDLWKIASKNSELISALQGAIRLAQENTRAIVDDEEYADRLNGLQVVLTEWEAT
ncbi:hypothetical protein EBT31_01645 [bacterium]|nr:hypothetical protein [bacterium]NBX48900.1 hypothetical protein [bacterium]